MTRDELQELTEYARGRKADSAKREEREYWTGYLAAVAEITELLEEDLEWN